VTDAPESVDSRWLRIKQIVFDAMDLPPEARAQLILQACGGDDALLGEVEALVRAHDLSSGFLDSPALAAPEIARAVIEATHPVAPPDPPPPERLGAYRILRELGRGGMGVVYLAARDDERYDKLVAIKVVAGDLLPAAVFQKFHLERRILASFEHPHIARLFDAGTTPAGMPYLVMEYVEGETLDAYCSTRRLPVRERLRLFGRLCDAVQYSHQHLVVHRDIKARNVVVTADGVPKLLDFGIAKLIEPSRLDGGATITGFRALTPESASPEQLRGEAVTVATDVYSLGILLYRLLTDRSPYRGDLKSEAAVIRAVCEEEPLRPSAAPLGAQPRRELRGDLDLITLKALRKEPARRYASVEQLAADVQRHLDRLPIRAAPDRWTYRARKFVARRWFGVSAAAALILALGAGAAATLNQTRRAERRFNDVRRLANTFMFEVHDAIENLPGSTAARKLLVSQALEYLDSLAREAGGDLSLQRELATAYEKMADVLGRPNRANLGDLHGALAAYRKSQAARERLLALEPGNRDVRHDLAATSAKMARVLHFAGDVPGAVEEARKAEDLAEALAGSPPTRGQILGLAMSYATYGYELGCSGKTVDGVERLRKAVGLLEPLQASSPEVKLQLALAYSDLAELLERGAPVAGLVPDLATALEMRRKALALEDPVAQADPLNGFLQRRVLASHVQLGDAQAMRGDRQAAVVHYRRALVSTERLAAADPVNLQARSDLALVGTRLGTLLAEDGEAEEALRLVGRSATLLESVLAADPANVITRARVADSSIGLGHAHAALGSSEKLTAGARRTHWREAKVHFAAGAAFWTEMRERGVTTGVEAQKPELIAREIARCDERLGRLAGPGDD
jgi:tetratricopeptide (TPR) repeat protein